MRFDHLFDCAAEDTTYFALTFPFSYTDCQELLNTYEQTFESHPKIYFYRELLTTSLEGRRVDMLTITARGNESDTTEELIPKLFPESSARPTRFKKPTIFVTARVHPGETQGSHMLNGLLSFLLKE
jgi:hypothetical protein